MATRIALNGFGRIGRTIFKVIKDRKLPLEVVALNDLAAPSELAYLLQIRLRSWRLASRGPGDRR